MLTRTGHTLPLVDFRPGMPALVYDSRLWVSVWTRLRSRQTFSFIMLSHLCAVAFPSCHSPLHAHLLGAGTALLHLFVW